MTARCSPAKISHSYFVVMLDLGRLGFEAIVQPERTRRNVIDRIANGDEPLRQIAFVHFVDGMTVEDVTAEIKQEATELREWLGRCDLQAAE